MVVAGNKGRLLAWLVVGLWGLSCALPVFGDIVVSEIMYHPSQDEAYEYIELTNTGDADQAISGWSLSSGVRFSFPQATIVPPGERVLVCGMREAVLAAYPDLDGDAVFGDWDGRLGNAGDTIVLSNASGTVVEVVQYDDDAPWDFLPDGFGPSLERVCLSESGLQLVNWRAGEVPALETDFGGTPLMPAAFNQCPAPDPVRPPVRISEIMYHPVLEEAFEDFHEYVELTNIGESAVELDGWRLVGGVDFTFPQYTLEPGAYLVVAHTREALLAVDAYGLNPDQVLGDYWDMGRELDNGGEKVGLVTADGLGVDSVSYDDDFPWAVGADAMGAGEMDYPQQSSENWLPQAWLPQSQYRYMGRSLERVSLTWATSSPANWLASPLDGPTPGRANTVSRDVPLPVVEDIDLFPAEPHPEDHLIRAADEVAVEVLFSDTSAVTNVQVTYYVEDLNRTNEPRETLSLNDNGEGMDREAGDLIFTGVFPAQASKSIVRYWIAADRGTGQETVSPRDTDPYAHFSYYVSPVVDAKTKMYEIYIAGAHWGRMYSDASPGRVSGCNLNPGWNHKVPAVFVYDGEVYDVFARYQGSRWNRTNGASISSWPYPRPSSGPLTALSWHINFPRYNRMKGKRIITLNKLTQGCPGFTASVGFRLFREVGVPASETEFIRYHVNGGYYRYMLALERPGEVMMEKWHDREAALNPELPREPVGYLFKSAGCNCDEGPYGWGDERVLNPLCGHSALTRYEHTYDSKTHEWAGGARVMEMIEALNLARRQGVPAIRTFFQDHFDIDLLMNYICVINWAVPFDDMFQNHFLYQRRSDGKWIMMPWDLDRDFGGWQGYNSSIYMGEQGNASNRSGWWNYLKDAFFKGFRLEYEERLSVLNNTVLMPAFIDPIVDEVLASADTTEASQAASRPSCSIPGGASSMKSFARSRHAYVNQVIPLVVAEAGHDMLAYVGQPVQFDATSSRPEPGENTSYTWSNGMTGDTPVWTFDEPGRFEIELTVTSVSPDGDDTDTVNVLVLESPAWVFEATEDGVVMEAESYHEYLPHDETACWWERASSLADASGGAYMLAGDIERQRHYSNYVDSSPELRYYIDFPAAGEYRLWIRAYTDDVKWDSLHVGLDGAGSTSGTYQRFTTVMPEWQWNSRNPYGAQVLIVDKPGVHLLSLWIRESGIAVDKLMLTRDLETEPEGLGPDESSERSMAGEGAYVRGDVNSDQKISLADPISLLQHLFAEPSLACEDHADSNDDGRLNLADALYLLQYLYADGQAPPAPFPQPGFDATEDAFDCGDNPT